MCPFRARSSGLCPVSRPEQHCSYRIVKIALKQILENCVASSRSTLPGKKVGSTLKVLP